MEKQFIKINQIPEIDAWIKSQGGKVKVEDAIKKVYEWADSKNYTVIGLVPIPEIGHSTNYMLIYKG